VAERAATYSPPVLLATKAISKLFGVMMFRRSFSLLSVALPLVIVILPLEIRSQVFHDSTTIQKISFQELLSRLRVATDSASKSQIVEEYLTRIRAAGHVFIEDSVVTFLYSGNARRVSVAGDINGWDPNADTLSRIAGTGLFFLSKSIPAAARFEYKLVVDSSWILDQLNARQVAGGYGPNSEIWMPFYKPPQEIEYRASIPRGRIDTLTLKSRLLQREHTIFIYLPPQYNTSRRKHFPTIYVTDGGEYITLAHMPTVLDNVIADKRIQPVVGVFIDPRTDIHNSQTSKRMQDYTLSDSFVSFVVEEVRKHLLKKYRLSIQARHTAIMGASLGGLISTYAAFSRPDVFGLAAAQSPSYWWKNDTLIALVDSSPRKNVKFYVDTGTMRDAQEKASKMVGVMLSKGYQVHYEEHPEGHNWINWRSRISHILEYFWGTQ
jgi:enterochelin esterase family protein